MNVSAIQTFLAVIQTGNLNKAAELVNVTQSTVTARLDALEDALGQKLLLRSRKGAVLTKAGFAFQRHAEAMIRSWDIGKRTVGLPGGFSGLFAVACEPDLWTGFGNIWLDQLKSDYPDVAFEAWPGTVEEIRRWLTSGLVDAALAREPLAGPAFNTSTATHDMIALVSSIDGEWPEQLTDYVYVDHGAEFRRWHAAILPDQLGTGLSFGSSDWALAHLLEKGGAAFLPIRKVRPYLDASQLFADENLDRFEQPVYLAARQALPDFPNRIDPLSSFKESVARAQN